jgi:MFS family permease
LGGLILGVFSWNVIFFVNLPLGVLGALMVLRFVPRDLLSRTQQFDLLGALLLFIGLLCFLLAITLGPHLSFASPYVIGLAVAASCAWVGFVRRELTVEHPLVDLGMFRNSTLSINVVTGVIVFVASSGLVFLLPFFLQNMQGRTPREAGLLLVTSPVMLGLSSTVAGWLSDRVGFRPLTVLGLALLTLAYLLVSTLALDTSRLGFVGRILWIGMGMGLFQSPNNSAIMGSVPREHLGVASGLLSLTRTVGQTAGIALIGAFWAALVVRLDAGQAEDVMAASAEARLLGLRWVARGIALLLCVALGLALSSWRRNRLT